MKEDEFFITTIILILYSARVFINSELLHYGTFYFYLGSGPFILCLRKVYGRSILPLRQLMYGHLATGAKNVEC